MEKIILHSQKISRSLACLVVHAYRLILSPCIGPCCCYHPSCSQYALDAIQQWGVVKGMWLISHRIFSCHPWAKGGYDPVPNEMKGWKGRTNSSN